MLTTNCDFLENELLDAARLFKRRPENIQHAFRFEGGVFYNDFCVDGRQFSFEDRGQVSDEIIFKRLERRFAKLRLYEILSALYDEKMGGWRIWYNGRRGNREYIGEAFMPGTFTKDDFI